VLPALTTDATNFIYTFNRADESEAEVALKFQWGTTLASWPNSVTVGPVSTAADGNGVVVTVAENGSSPDTITITVPRINAVAGKLFGRVQAVK
jgi:hypothetical protein